MNELETRIAVAVTGYGYKLQAYKFFLAQNCGPLVVKIRMVEIYGGTNYEVVEMMGGCWRLDTVLFQVHTMYNARGYHALAKLIPA